MFVVVLFFCFLFVGLCVWVVVFCVLLFLLYFGEVFLEVGGGGGWCWVRCRSQGCLF